MLKLVYLIAFAYNTTPSKLEVYAMEDLEGVHRCTKNRYQLKETTCFHNFRQANKCSFKLVSIALSQCLNYVKFTSS